MVYKNFDLPATLIHTVNGKKYTLNGKLLGINESAKTCTMQFGDKVNENIPLNEVYLNEAALKDIIKKAGKKLKGAVNQLWEKIKGIAKIVGGWLVPVDEDGNNLIQFINNPLNLAVMPLPTAVSYAPSGRTLDICKDNGAKIVNKGDIDDAFASVEAEERKGIETYWQRVIREYAKPENESLSLSDTIKMVNESYYSRPYEKELNESIVSLKSGNERMYGQFVNTEQLVGLITDNIWDQLNPLYVDKTKKNDEGYVKPLLIWGAPGIGKTAIIKSSVKQMKQYYNTNLDIVTMACGGLKQDDFSLPDTAINQYGIEIAVEIPKTWLPVYDVDSLTDEQATKIDNFYNSGRYRIRDYMKNDVKNRKNSRDGHEEENVFDTEDRGVGESYNGGVLFFDEFARLRNQKLMDLMMALCGDRRYQKMKLASGWVTMCAANRLTDDKLPEYDTDFRSMWGEAMKTRFTHYTFVPTKKEWLVWAREVNKEGYQNVDELICKFIERSPDYVWYDALDFGSKDITDADIQRILGISQDDSKNIDGETGKGSWGTTALTRDELRKVNKFNTDTNNMENLDLVAWNGRTWDQKISRKFLNSLRQLFFNHPDWYEDCFSVQKRARSINGGASSQEYSVKNLDTIKLRENLNKLDRNRWFIWSANKYQTFDPGQSLRNNDRLEFVMKYLGFIIEAETGKDGKVIKQWKHYNSVDTVISETDIQYIYNTGQFKSIASKRDDNIIFDKQSDYTQALSVNWKSNPEGVDEVVSKVLASLSDNISIEDIVRDQKRIVKYAGKYAVTPADEEMYIDRYTLHLTDENRKEIETIPTLFIDTQQYAADLKERVIFVLKQSEVARKLANVAMWISKIAIQVNSNTAINAALGDGQHSENGIGAELFKLIEKNDEALQFYKQSSEITKYQITAPAITILEAMRFYRR